MYRIVNLRHWSFHVCLFNFELFNFFFFNLGCQNSSKLARCWVYGVGKSCCSSVSEGNSKSVFNFFFIISNFPLFRNFMVMVHEPRAWCSGTSPRLSSKRMQVQFLRIASKRCWGVPGLFNKRKKWYMKTFISACREGSRHSSF